MPTAISALKPNFHQLVILLVLTASLAGCGFQLKQSAAIPAGFGPVAITGIEDYSNLHRTIRSYLRGSSIDFATENSSPNHTINISTNRDERRVLSVTSAGKVAEYELIKVLSFSVFTASGDKMIESQTLSVNRFYTVSGSDALEDEREEADIKRQMEAELVDRMFRYISAKFNT